MQVHPDVVCQQKECERMVDGFVFDSIATKQKKWNDFDISNIMDSNEIIIQIIPITNGNNACIGVRVRSNDGTSLTHRFDTSSNESIVSIECMQIIGIPIEDGKVSFLFYCICQIKNASSIDSILLFY
jgi:hypothetical protein